LDDIQRRDAVEVPRRGRDGTVPELLGDGPGVDLLGAPLRRVGVAGAVGVDSACAEYSWSVGEILGLPFPRFAYQSL
jgi:hypothetical protein